MTGSNTVTYDGSSGTAFAFPRGIWVDSMNRIYVTDETNDLIYRFDDMSGANQTEYNGSAGLSFTNPTSIVVR